MGFRREHTFRCDGHGRGFARCPIRDSYALLGSLCENWLRSSMCIQSWTGNSQIMSKEKVGCWKHGYILLQVLAIFILTAALGNLWTMAAKLRVMANAAIGTPSQRIISTLGPPNEEWSRAEWLKNREERARNGRYIDIADGVEKIVLYKPYFSSGCFVFIDKSGLVIGNCWYTT